MTGGAPLRSRLGMTIIELLVVIAVIAVLVAILIPALSGVRNQAMITKMLSNIKSTSVSMSLYTSRYGEAFPWRSESQQVPMSPPNSQGESDIYITFPHFNLSIYWPGLMHEIAPWSENYSTWIPVDAKTGSVPWRSPNDSGFLLPVFELSHSYLARPELWRADALQEQTLLRGVKEADVVYPSSKAMFVTMDWQYHLGDPNQLPIGFGDGSVSMRKVDEAVAPIAPNWKTPNPRRLHDTPDGVRGRDY